MGNVSAAESAKASAGTPAPPLIPPPPPTEIPKSKPKETQGTASGAEGDRNPGLYEDLHKQTKELFPQVFEGAKVIVAKGLSSHFQISHTLTLSTFSPSGYRFGATYIGTKQISPTEAFPVLLGDVDSNGNLNANIIHALTDRLRGKLVAQFQGNKCVGQQISFDYKGDDFTSSLTTGNLDPINMSGLVVAHYLQRITPRLALGAELMYQRGMQVPGGEIAIMSMAGKWSGDKWQLTTNLSPMAGNLHTCFYQRVHEYLQVGVELETSLRMSESVGTVAYQIDIPKADVTFKGQVDSNWCIGGVMEKKLAPFPFTLALSGYANHVKGQYRFGIGMIIG
ncbi:mitochondrial import receptor subunit TOM40 homolog 1 [Aplysia californica]|uniref:Mitochondrial import receptor subunit TOM40 homolog 1 n=1 Tax=Aplysia californica TaxID=6500 RepID=A0ABM0K7K7_APLCA|nr:mitochondrial import receptor subunit TOM40 homolog 1 [Aplysia californica]